MLKHFLAFALLLAATAGHSQNYTSYRTGAPGGVDPIALGGVCLMGGATENDNAMSWFLQRASGGDVVVLRASGSDGYNDYMYTDLGGINSVETIVFNNASAAYEPHVHQVILDAEAIWFAGGDQWDYVSYWNNTPIDSLVREAVNQRNVAIGGTSAGMAVLGGIRYTAQNGSITSAQALANPYATTLTLSNDTFFQVPQLENLITDTHYDDPDRRGRHFTFLARAMAEYGLDDVRGIACNEYTAVCIAPDGTARVYGDFPNYDEYAYFLRANCTAPNEPEVCVNGTSLTWDRAGAAVQVYKVPGVQTGTNGMNIQGWNAEVGGAWEHWTAIGGTFSSAAGIAWSCTTGLPEVQDRSIDLWYDAIARQLVIHTAAAGDRLSVLDTQGRLLHTAVLHASGPARIDLPALATQTALVRIEGDHLPYTRKVVLCN